MGRQVLTDDTNLKIMMDMRPMELWSVCHVPKGDVGAQGLREADASQN